LPFHHFPARLSPAPHAVHAELASGETYEGQRFLVPRTADTVQSFINPASMNFFTFAAYASISLNLFLSFVVRVPIWVNICIFFFWRAMYNGGLGYLLNAQSTRKQMTAWFTAATRDPNSAQTRFLQGIAAKALPAGYTPSDFPPAFNAWLVYKGLVNFVLVNDSTSYSMLALRLFAFPSEWSLAVVLQYLVGAVLFAFNWWAKKDAHRCIGTYCWYWGDFFYRKNVNLTFDGIFELFPHPMYTVGYSVYYGISLVTRSYTVLFVSLAAHLAQIAFLVLVEEPHIKRTYGDGGDAPARDEKALYDAQQGLFPSRSDFLYLGSVDLFSAGTWALVIACVYSVAVALLPESPVYAVAQVIIWRVLHWGVLGALLYTQSTRQLWTRDYERRGRPLYEAFSNWKVLYSLSSAVNVCVFVACAVRFLPVLTMDTIFSATFAAKCAVGTVLGLLALWTSYSTYVAVGDFGWFYGDFFIPPAQYRNELCYTGIYRFLNNPDAVTGYAGLYGLALVCDGWTVCGLALLSQLANLAFVQLVEMPHMKKIYESHDVRNEGPLPRKIKSLIKDTIPVPAPVRSEKDRIVGEMRAVRTRALVEVYSIYRRVASLRRKESEAAAAKKGVAAASATSLTVPSVIPLGAPLEVRFATAGDHADTDWIGVYAVDTPSAPGLSDGMWLYVPLGAQGSVTFKPAMLPRADGVYEVRYHKQGHYDVAASQPVVFSSDATVKAKVDAVGSPVFGAVSAGVTGAVGAAACDLGTAVAAAASKKE
jgi:phosphatidylethanolamine N-methyltransferase